MSLINSADYARGARRRASMEYEAAQKEQPTKKEPQVKIQVDFLERVSDELAKLVDSFYARLSPILTKRTPSGEGTEKAVENMVPLAKKLNNIGVKVNSAKLNMQEILNRLEI